MGRKTDTNKGEEDAGAVKVKMVEAQKRAGNIANETSVQLAAFS